MNTYREFDEFLGKRREKKLMYKTFAYRVDSTKIAIEHHNTRILIFHKNGDVVYKTDGWRSPTTKKRLNKYGLAGVRIYQKNFVWYFERIIQFGGEYFDGITFKGENHGN